MRQLPQIKARIWPYLNISNFYGGLNKRDAPSEISDNEAQDLLNIDFGESGSISKRAGTNIVGDDVGDAKVLGLYSCYYNGGASKLLMVANAGATTPPNLFYRTNGAWTAGTAAAFANADVEFETFLGAGAVQFAFFSDGTTLRTYNPSTNAIASAAAAPATISNVMRVYANRLYMRGNSSKLERLYFSALGNGESWGASDYFDVPSRATNETGSAGDMIIALASFQDRLVIFKWHSIWTWDGTVLRKLSDHGCIGKRAFVNAGNYLYFADYDGVYRLSGTSVQKVSEKIQTIWDTIPWARKRECAMGFFRGKLYVTAATSGATYNNIILVNYASLPQDSEGQQPWSYWQGTTANPLAASVFAVYEESVIGSLPIICFGRANAQSVVLQLETGNADYDVAGAAQNESIDGYYKTKDFSLSARFKKLFLAMKKRASSYNLNVSAVIDYQTTRHLTYDMYAASGDALTKSGKISYNGKYINYKFATSASSAQPFMVYDAKQEFKPLKLK